MKKVVGKSLALGALALGLLSLLGGPNVFSLLKNIKFPSKSKKQESPVKEAEKTKVKEEVKPEEQIREVQGTEIALEEGPQEKTKQEIRVEEPVEQVETTRQEEKVKVDKATEPIQQTQPQVKPAETPKIKPLKDRIKKLEDGTTEYTTRSGERIIYRGRIPIWRSTSGRLIDTPEEIKWRDSYVPLDQSGGDGKKGTGMWCANPWGIEEVEYVDDCPKGSRNSRNKIN